MKVVAAYLLAVLGGNATPSADDLKNILGSVGAESDEEMISLLLSQVEGKDVTELIAAGREMMASVVGCGGGGISVAAVASGPSDGGVAASAAVEEAPKMEEKDEESDDAGLFGLFD